MCPCPPSTAPAPTRTPSRSAGPSPTAGRVASKRGSLEVMHYRTLGRTGWEVSDISFGAWAIGSAWGSVDDAESHAALEKAIDCGVNFIDTADVYGMGRSERLIAQLKRERKEAIVVATKAGRPPFPPTPRGGNPKKL